MSVEETSKSLPSTSAAASVAETLTTEQSTSQNNAVGTSAIEQSTSGSSNNEYVRLRVISADDSTEIHFRVKPISTLERLKRSYSSKMGSEVYDFRFLFDGHRIADGDTPEELGMVNDDVIEVYQEKIGGM